MLLWAKGRGRGWIERLAEDDLSKDDDDGDCDGGMIQL